MLGAVNETATVHIPLEKLQSILNAQVLKRKLSLKDEKLGVTSGELIF